MVLESDAAFPGKLADDRKGIRSSEHWKENLCRRTSAEKKKTASAMKQKKPAYVASFFRFAR